MPETTLGERVLQTERELILSALDEAKKRAPAELRISVTKDPKTGLTELVYVGVSQKADLDSLRKLYAAMKSRGPNAVVTF